MIKSFIFMKIEKTNRRRFFERLNINCVETFKNYFNHVIVRYINIKVFYQTV